MSEHLSAVFSSQASENGLWPNSAETQTVQVDVLSNLSRQIKISSLPHSPHVCGLTLSARVGSADGGGGGCDTSVSPQGQTT